MLKNWVAFFLVVCVLVGLFALPAAKDYGFNKGVAHLKHGNPRLLTAWDTGAGDYSVFEGLKYEVVRVEFTDGAFFQTTSLQPHSVTFMVHELTRVLGTVFRRGWGDVSVVIHNHPKSPTFSRADTEALEKLRAAGFLGAFVLWHKGVLTTHE